MTDLDQLTAEDPVVRQLARIMRDGQPSTLEEAVAELSQLVDPVRVEAAAARIRELNELIQQAQTPTSVVAGNIESWYPGPREEDRNWSALVDILRGEGWSDDMLHDLNQSSTKVVANLPNPAGDGEYQCRGLVLGYVQSGKTTNFTAVIAKAADAGYRMFIVLSGIHDALRQQTQDRLNEQLWEPLPDKWHRLTNEQDFRPTDNVDALLSTRDQRVLAVVKKNGPRLRALKNWLFAARPEVLAACPVLIIDDEADQATVNTAKPDRQPTRINGLIRAIVNGTPKSAYVGYTATPFANVLIDPQQYEDLYPRDFIVDLPRPTVYIGPDAIFGREPLDFDDTDVGDDGNNFVRSVPEEEIDDLRPKGAARRHLFEPTITDSLDAALKYFLMSTAARRARGKGNPHATALVHSSQHIDVHERTAEAIKGHLRSLSARVSRRDPGLLAALEAQWVAECEQVSADTFGLNAVDWTEVDQHLPAVAQAVEVITDNSRSIERLNFDDTNPRVIVAVGGNTLSRGLTLEGLAVSFFVRTASAYDTLLQMGRWFGYRNGYADLTRIWMTDEMREWFHHLATVEQEIRYDIERLEVEHLTPEQFGIRIRTHPKLAITAASKMQHARRAQVSYAGRRLQTILFNHKDSDWLSTNLDAARSLLQTVVDNPHQKKGGITTIRGVDSQDIISFLSAYNFHENSRDLDGELISRYILSRRDDGELTRFNIVIMGRTSASDYLGEVDLGLTEKVGCINRARLDVVGGPTYADIKALMSRNDRVIDLELPEGELTEKTSNARLVQLRNAPGGERGGFGDGSGLLLLYPVSKDSRPVRGSATTRTTLDAVEHIIGVGIVFPESRSARADVEYVTADVAAMAGVEVDAPDDNDVPDEPELQEAG
ncbi:Z1 domain-containing protein [Mycolicibacterium sp. 120270]|uniref:Z1 domain-containing protein n=1 Tax=Mycolicibacterium sp. 120270 TaxID=3090600 RepID=UPI00299F0A74|nr:Z1 domain-containing protein [Mycolicibacterium sp. 120270]MDX1883236.1 Z1 domain-containing protein [Mycolicibacterium sp. 120270]